MAKAAAARLTLTVTRVGPARYGRVGAFGASRLQRGPLGYVRSTTTRSSPPVFPSNLPSLAVCPCSRWVRLALQTAKSNGSCRLRARPEPPKLVVHTLRTLMGAIVDAPLQQWATFYDIRRYGGLQIFLRALSGRGSLILGAEGESVSSLLARFGGAKVTHISGTPTHWRKVSPAAKDFGSTRNTFGCRARSRTTRY